MIFVKDNISSFNFPKGIDKGIDNATIVFISFIFFISFNFPKRKQTMQLLSLSSFIFFISFNFPKKEVANEMLSRKRDSNP